MLWKKWKRSLVNSKTKERCVQLKEEYTDLLSKHICYIGFEKTTGVSRFMVATLIPMFIKQKLNPSFKHLESKPNQLVVWDLEKGSWRRLKVSSIAIFKKFK